MHYLIKTKKMLLTLIASMWAVMFVSASTVDNLTAITTTYVYAFDDYTKNGAGTRSAGSLFGGNHFLDVNGGSVSTSKKSIDIADLATYVAINGTDTVSLAAKYTTYGSHLNSLRLKNTQDVIALKPIAGSVIYLFGNGNNKEGALARIPLFATDASLSEVLNEAPDESHPVSGTYVYKFEVPENFDGTQPLYIGSYNGDAYFSFIVVEVPSEDAPLDPDIDVPTTSNYGVWDFTNFSEETLAGLQNDYIDGGCWSQTSDTRYTLQCEQQTLTYNANGVNKPIKETEGLLFTGSGSGYLYFDYGGTSSCIKFNSTDLTVTIPGLTNGTMVTIVTKTGNSSSQRGIVCTTDNAVRKSGEEVSLEENINIFEVTCDEGTTTDVTFQPYVGGINIYSISSFPSEFIKNPDAAEETGWVIDKGTGNTNTASGQHYSGDANARYFDSWNPTVGALNYNATQTITYLPNNTYTLKFAGRSSGTKGAFVYVVTGSDTLWVEMKANAIASVDENGNPCISYVGDLGGKIWEDAAEGSAEKAVHDGNGYGWNWYETPTFDVTDNSMIIGITTDSLVSGVPFDGSWFSVTDFELHGAVSASAKELLENIRYQVLDYATWLEIEGWKSLGQSLSESYESTYTTDTTSATAVSKEIIRLNNLLSKYKNIVEAVESPISSYSFSTTVTVGDWSITLDENKNVAYVSGYNVSEKNIIVPESFTYNKKEYYTVGVGPVSSDDYFYYTSWFYPENIESVELPVTLRFIGDYAFDGCTKLAKISIPSRVELIGKNSFNECCSLTSLELPNSVTSIGYQAFSSCSDLTNITIPNSVTSIGEFAFSGCSSLKKIKLPESLTTIQGYTFHNCSALKSLIIPNSVKSIGEYAFQNCGSLTFLQSEATTAPTCAGSFYASNLRTIYVPAGSGASYRSASYWKNYIIVDGEGVSVTVNVETPGTLGDLILDQVENLSDVNHLTVTGSLNDDDIYNIQNRMPDLLTIDLSGTDITALSDNMFYQHYALQKVILPEGLKSIGSYAFYQCYDMQDVEFPSTLTSIGNWAFYGCRSINHVIIPEGVTTVGSNAFAYCKALQTVKWASTATVINDYMFSSSSVENIEIPEGLTSIGSNAFSYSHLKTLECPSTLNSIGGSAFYACESLASVKFKEGLESLGENAFYNCDMLTEIVLPSTLFDCNMSFNGCDNLITVKCLALLPPYLYNRDPLYNVNREQCTLYVPAWTINKYKQTVGWDEFPVIKPLENYLPEYIKPNQDVTLILPDTLPADYKPVFVGGNDVEDDHYTALTVNGNGTFSIKEFSLSYDVEWEARSNGAYITHNTLVNNVAMRADSVYIWVEMKNNQWSFLSFPFDVKVSDILPTQKNTNYVIRRYSGKDRAEANFAETWQDMTVDSILHAGEGYIWQSSRYDDAGNSQSSSAFIVSAINNTNKNLIFANSDRTVALNEHLSEFSHNRSWNLIGNPYPCYYDTRATDFTAPITVWNMSKSTYSAYSPIDDEYILRPGEAFFVQRPVDQESITFSTTGRQTDRTVRDITTVTGARSVSASRQVFNIYLSNGSLSDHTRFVINAKAEMNYNMSHDAGKFMSNDAMTPQLFTIENGVHYAINERPMGNGVITLGTYFGSEGAYTLALDTEVQTEVILVDKLIGKKVNLAAADYTFSAEAGTVTDRFEIKFGGATSVEENLAQHVSVQAVGGQIVVNGAEDVEAVVYTTDGKQIAIVKGNAALDVNPGLYIVKVQGKSYKVSVVR